MKNFPSYRVTDNSSKGMRSLVSFRDLILRADEEVLQTILGAPIIRVLMSLDAKLASPTQLRELLTQLKGPASLLVDKDYRAALLPLLRFGEAAELCATLGLSGSNVYKELEKASFRSRSAKSKLLHFFGLETPEDEAADNQAPDTVNIEPSYRLFPHQRQAARDVRSALSVYPHRVLLHMPTGAGKTRAAMDVIAEHLRTHEPTLVIWLAYSEELCEQAAQEFAKCWGRLGNRDISIHRFWGAHALQLTDQVQDGFVVAGLAKVYAALKNDTELIMKLGSRSSLLVMDEAHQSVAESYQAVLKVLFQLGHKQTRLLGLTATPGRSWDDISADTELAEFYDRRKVTLNIPGYSNPVDFLVSQRYLAKTTFRSLSYQGGTAITGRDIGRISAALDIPEDILKRLGEDVQRNLLIISSVEGLVERHRRILIFAASVEHSDLLAGVLQARGLDAQSVTSKTPHEQRVAAIGSFKDRATQVKILCNYGVLTTGFDAPQTSAVFIARPTKSLVLYSQMVGRGIRGERAGGNKNAEIYTVVDLGLPGFGKVAEAFMNWEDVWNEEQ